MPLLTPEARIVRAREIVSAGLDSDDHKRCTCRAELLRGEWDRRARVRDVAAALCEGVDSGLQTASEIAGEAQSWGLSPTKLEVHDATKRFIASVILAQKSDSPERAAHE